MFPGAEEDYNDIDDDCDDQLDENSYAYDDDGDGFTELDDNDDCDDNDPWTYPDADEDCDGRDNDCDDIIDEGEDGEADGACAYLVEHQPTVTESEATCATSNAAPPWRWIWIAALVGLLRRRQRN